MENYGHDCKGLTLNSLNAAQDKLQYNADGGLFAWNVYDDKLQRAKGNSPQVARGLLELDGLGHSVREHYQDEKGNGISNAYGWTDSRARFDKHGNMISRFNHDISGKLQNNPRLGYAGYELSYDQQSLNRLSLRYFDEKGIPVIHKLRGYHQVKTEYNASGLRQTLTFLDVDGSPVNRKDTCVASMHYEYDEKQRVKSISLYDDKNQLVIHCRQGWQRRSYVYYENGPLKETIDEKAD